jgi:hypothetical protein
MGELPKMLARCCGPCSALAHQPVKATCGDWANKGRRRNECTLAQGNVLLEQRSSMSPGFPDVQELAQDAQVGPSGLG